MRLDVVKIFSLKFASIISKMAELQSVSKICLFTDRFELHWINQSVGYLSKEGKRPSTSLKIGVVNFGSGTEVDGISIVDRSDSVQL